MRASVLASGSRGNCVYVESGETAFLVDCGIAMKTLKERLASIERDPQAIRAIFVTHDHGDHVGTSVGRAKRLKVPLFATAGTHSVLRALPKGLGQIVRADVPVQVGCCEVLPVATPHDGIESVAFRVVEGRGGRGLGIVTDLGYVTQQIVERMTGVHTLVAEHNHDTDMLLNGPYPQKLKQRIRGGRGHLSNNQGAQLASALSHAGLSRVVLAHLSETNNTPELARRAYQRENGTRMDREVLIADQWAATPLFEV